MSDDHELQRRALERLGSTLRGKYRLDAVLGVGGMAVVYAATHRNQAEFAIKMLHPELSLSTDLRTRFLREGYAANSVKHPGAVLVVDDDVAEDGAAFLVMERLYGASAEDLLDANGQRLPVRIVVPIVLRLLDVLVAAHEKGIVHRDIKPANIFVTRDGSVKVLDFGIARARDALQSNGTGTGTGVILGTPAYMAPEQAMAKSSEIDERTDVWAAGATLYSMLSGDIVHSGDNAHQLLIHAATIPAKSVLTVAPDVPPAVAAVIDQALSFERAARFPTAAAMRDALASAIAAVEGGAGSVGELAVFAGGSADTLRTSQNQRAWNPLSSTPTAVAPGASGPVPVHGFPLPGAIVATQSALSSRIDAAPPAGGRKRTAMYIALGAMPLLAGALGLGWHFAHAGDAAPAVAGAGGDPVAPVAADAAAVAASADSTASTIPAPRLVPVPDLASAPVGVPPTSGPSVNAKGKGTTKPPVASPPHPKAAKPDCTPPYDILPNGEHHFKVECL